jgi:hypothetical protein
VYENHKLYKVCSLVTDSATPAFVCVVEKRLASYKPEAFLEVRACVACVMRACDSGSRPLH